MNVSLTAQLESFIQEKVQSGRYQSASEVVREGLRLLQDQERLRELKIAELKKEIAVGIAQANRGELVEGKTAFRELRARARKRIKKGA